MPRGAYEFLRIAETIISSLSTASFGFVWEIVQGRDFNFPITVGHTVIQGTFGITPQQTEKIKKKLQKSNSFVGKPCKASLKVSFNEACHKYHDVEKLIFFGKLQLSLINVSININIILWTDYGTGKH